MFLCVLFLCCLVNKYKDRLRNGENYEVIGVGYNDRGQNIVIVLHIKFESTHCLQFYNITIYVCVYFSNFYSTIY